MGKGVRGWGLERGYVPSPENDFFHFKIVYSGTFPCINSKVLFALKMQRKVHVAYIIITLYSWRLTLIQT